MQIGKLADHTNYTLGGAVLMVPKIGVLLAMAPGQVFLVKLPGTKCHLMNKKQW